MQKVVPVTRLKSHEVIKWKLIARGNVYFLTVIAQHRIASFP